MSSRGRAAERRDLYFLLFVEEFVEKIANYCMSSPEQGSKLIVAPL
jgi:hypothetical protein